MKTYAKLNVRGEPEHVVALGEALDEALRLADGWRRDTEKEQWLSKKGVADLRCYDRDPSADHPGVLVWLDVSGGSLRVTNITPIVAGALSISEYNAVVRELHAVLAGLASIKQVRVGYDDGEDAFRGHVTPSVVRLLEDFATATCDQADSGHPEDRERWMKFVLASHREKVSLGGELLSRWLQEEYEFPFDFAERLAAEYENSRELLRRNEQDAA